MAGLSLTDTCPGNLEGVSAGLFLTLINTFMATKCTLGDAINYPEDYGPKLKNDDEFDFIVVGAGSGGSVVANKLSENKDWKVLVLEAGGLPSSTSDIPLLLFSLQGTKEDWAYKTEPNKMSSLGLKDKQSKWPRGKVLGGSSVLNAMLYVKGNKRDYDNWAKLGNTGWDWDSIKGYFTELERILPPESEETPLGTKGLMPLTKFVSEEPAKFSMQEGFEQLGIKHLKEQNPENPIGTVNVPMCTNKGQRANVGKVMLGKFKDRKNLHVSLHSFVQKIIIENNTAKGVEVNVNGKLLKLKTKKEVIVSGGSINSPQLLMLSGIGPRDHLKSFGIKAIKDLPVGQFMEDHPIFVGFVLKLDSNAVNIPKYPTDPLYEYFLSQKGPLSSVSITNFLVFLNTKNDSKWPDSGFHYLLFPPGDSVVLPAVIQGLGFSKDAEISLLKACENKACLMMIPTLLAPKSSGKILLKSANSEDSPLIYSGYLSDKGGEDLKVLLEDIRFCEKVIDTPPFIKHKPELIKLPLPECDKFEYQSDAYWKCSLRHLSTTVYHPIGTCLMGSSEKQSVVDPRLRVHGVKNLRVADASVMPKIVSGNTHAPSMMIGYKASEMIKEDWNEADFRFKKHDL